MDSLWHLKINVDTCERHSFHNADPRPWLLVFVPALAPVWDQRHSAHKLLPRSPLPHNEAADQQPPRPVVALRNKENVAMDDLLSATFDGIDKLQAMDP
jgi:hypothetical protein